MLKLAMVGPRFRQNHTQIALDIFEVAEIKILEGTCLQNKLDISALKPTPGSCLSPESLFAGAGDLEAQGARVGRG